jgi:hypothetical protein
MKLSSFVVHLFLISGSTLALAAEPAGKTYDIFDGKSLAGWKIADFGGQDEVTVKKGEMIIPVGQDMSGVTWDVKNPPHGLKLPTENYELNLEAMRVDGSDFFCAITFPLGDSPCSLILCVWGGGVVGLSSIDGFDASENETTQYLPFENEQWYKIRLRVTDKKISAWIDGKEMIDIERGEKKFSIRSEVELNRPLGFSTWQTKGALRNIKLTVFQADTQAAAKLAKADSDAKAEVKPEAKADAKPKAKPEAKNDARFDANEDEASPSDRPIEIPAEPAQPPVAEPAAPVVPPTVAPPAASQPSCTSCTGESVQSNCCQSRFRWRHFGRRCGRRCR